jgi:hypothetical protein
MFENEIVEMLPARTTMSTVHSYSGNRDRGGHTLNIDSGNGNHNGNGNRGAFVLAGNGNGNTVFVPGLLLGSGPGGVA